ncbi:MAG: hypothetical protein QW203_03665 [Thermoplasmatales archaeon]
MALLISSDSRSSSSMSPYISFTLRFIANSYFSGLMTDSSISNLVCISPQFSNESLLTAKMNVGQLLKTTCFVVIKPCPSARMVSMYYELCGITLSRFLSSSSLD